MTKDITLILTFSDKGTVKVKKAVGATKKQLLELEKAGIKAGKGLTTMKKHAEASAKGMGKFRKVIKSTAAQMAMGMGAMMGVQGAVRAIKGAVVDFIATGREFEREWANVTTMLSISTEETEGLKWELIKMSPTLGDVTELARGMYQVLSASIEPSKAIKFLGSAAKAAVAGVTETFVAVDALTTVINAYGMAAEDVTAVSDIMFQTVKRGKLTYADMSGALGTVVPIAAQVGIKFEEIAAAMATLTRQGVNVNTTTMSLRQVMVSVLKPTSDAVAMAKKLGLEFNAQAMAAKGLGGFLADVKEKTEGDTEAMTMLFGNVRALVGVMGLAGVSAAEFAYDIRLMGQASGSTEEAFQKQMRTVDFWVKTFSNTLKKMKVAFYEGLVGPMRDVITTQEGLEEAMSGAVETAELLGKVFGSIGVVLKWLEPIWKRELENAAALPETIARFIEIGSRGLIPMYSKMMQKKKETIVQMIRERKEQQKLGKSYGGVYGKMLEGFGWWKKQVNLYMDSGIACDDYLEKLRLLRGGQAEMQEDLVALQAIEDLGIKSKMRLELEYTVLANKIKIAAKSGKVFTSQLKTQAKKALDLSKVIGKKLDRELRILAGDYTVLAEEAGTLDPILVEGTQTLRGVDEAIAELDLKMKGLYVVTTNLAEGMGFVLTPAMITQMQNMKKMGELAQKYGVALRGQVIVELEKAKTAFDTLTTSQDENLRVTEAGEKALVQLVIDLHKSANIELPEIWKKRAEAHGIILGDEAFSWKEHWKKLTENITRMWTEGIAELIAGTSNFSDFLKNSWSILGTFVGGVVQGLVSSALTSIGAMAGPIGAIIGGLAAGVFSLIGSFLGIKSAAQKAAEEAEEAERRLEEAVRRTQAAFRDYGNISEEFAKDFLEMKKQVGAFKAEFIMLPALMQETGITMQNVGLYAEDLIDLVEAMQKGMFDYYEGVEIVGESWDKLIEGVIRMGLEGTPEIVTLIQALRELGLSVAEVDEYVFKWLEKASTGLNQMAKALTGPQDEMERLGDLTFATYDAFLQQGQGWTATMDQMLESLTTLREKYEELGYAGTGAIDRLLELGQIREIHSELFKAIDANTEVLKALGNTGFLTGETLADIGEQVEAYYNQLQGLGFTTEEALRVMVPSFKELEHYAESYDYQLSAGVQALIDSAKEQGILKDAFIDTIEGGIDRIVNELRDIKDELREERETRLGVQHGFHGDVVGPKTFYVEPGVRERVDITPEGQGGETGGEKVVVVQPDMQPILIPWGDMEGWLLEFLQERFETENLLTSPRSVRGK